MKKLITILGLFFIISSCSVDTGERYVYQYVPIENVDIPDEFRIGETYPITMHYRLPTTCDFYSNMVYQKDLNVRTIAIQSGTIQGNSNCQTTPIDRPLSQTTFNFKVTNNGSYIFKFWQGQNDQGDNIFIEVEVPVVE